jgi:hypothetical protein
MSRIIQPITPLERSINQAPAAPSAPPVSGPSTPNANQYTKPTTTANTGTAGTSNVPKTNTPKGNSGGIGPSPQGKPNQPKPTPGKSTPPKSAPTYQPYIDPRDSTYYSNTAALSNMLGQNIAGALLDQQLANNAFAENSERMSTDRARARRNLAESLLGTGGIRSGAHRREQTERDQDYMIDRNRLGYDYGNDKANRDIEIAGYKTSFKDQKQAEYLSASDRKAAQLKEEAATGTGNRSPSPRDQIRGYTKQIENLRKKLPDANKKQSDRIRKRIKEIRQKRATTARQVRQDGKR